MTYEKVIPGIFKSRPNRFIAHVETAEGLEVCHVKNTGRCRELLVEGARVYLSESGNSARKTRFDLVAVEKGDLLINMDSQAPNKVAAEYMPDLLPGLTLLRPETKFGSSRFDFYAEASGEKWFVEVKGVTLERGGLTLFPDAPTLRGAKHLRELCGCIKEGYRACALFVVQMSGVRGFTPNFETDPEFAKALIEAGNSGVRLEAVDCFVTPESLSIRHKLPILLHFEKNLQQN
ncbi:MAG: DNA/RNA nuclease SfsA [Acutalibacter sp.]|jgi:sugar fermentation stimulation protein A|uniref:DNA/RNA nuclease SfsA n=1 Tax=Acutalibacter sp. TaxID=1918636 RepID=UPI002171D92A|nr:DNA/RNA nuclease SfsA [Acutalibacter sp.]MCI9226077.1 DNA/RNA nuclease SfsA [Acutalibacter sp.]